MKFLYKAWHNQKNIFQYVNFTEGRQKKNLFIVIFFLQDTGDKGPNGTLKFLFFFSTTTQLHQLNCKNSKNIIILNKSLQIDKLYTYHLIMQLNLACADSDLAMVQPNTLWKITLFWVIVQGFNRRVRFVSYDRRVRFVSYDSRVRFVSYNSRTRFLPY